MQVTVGVAEGGRGGNLSTGSQMVCCPIRCMRDVLANSCSPTSRHFFLQIKGSPGPFVASLQRSNGPTDPKLALIETSFVGWEIKFGWPKSKGEKRATYMTGKEGGEGHKKDLKMLTAMAQKSGRSQRSFSSPFWQSPPSFTHSLSQPTVDLVPH